MSRKIRVRNFFAVLFTIFVSVITLLGGIVVFNLLRGIGFAGAHSATPFVFAALLFVIAEWIICIVRNSKRISRAKAKLQEKKAAMVAVKQWLKGVVWKFLWIYHLRFLECLSELKTHRCSKERKTTKLKSRLRGFFICCFENVFTCFE